MATTDLISIARRSHGIALIVCVLCALTCRHEAGAQPAAQTQPRPESAVAESQPHAVAEIRRTTGLPPETQEALEAVEDFSFSFDSPGFRRLITHLKTRQPALDTVQTPLEIDDWTTLLERPADFRGLPITIDGIVGRNKVWRFEDPTLRALGPLWQLELWHPDQPITATVILTLDAADVPLGATIRVSGHFVMIRQYYSDTDRVRQAALIAGLAPTMISRSESKPLRNELRHTIGVIAALAVGLLLAWWILRRATRTRRVVSMPQPAPRTPAPFSVADDLAAWAESGDASQADERQNVETTDDDATDDEPR